MSEFNFDLYRTLVQPYVRLIVTKPVAQMIRRLNPLRLSYTIFADDNPAMAPIVDLAEQARAERQPVAQDNSLWLMQEAAAKLIERTIDIWRQTRDNLCEAWFFAVYGSPFVQCILGTAESAGAVRHLPPITPADVAAYQAVRSRARAKLREGGVEEAIVRALLFVLQGEGRFDERVAAAFRELHMRRGHLTRENLKRIVRDQAAVLQLDPQRAIDNLTDMVPDENRTRPDLLELVTEVVGATGPPDIAAKVRLDRIATALLLEPRKDVFGDLPAKCVAAES